jgi:hypothetical protein
VKYSVLLSLALATGCVARIPAASSRSVLGPARSQVTVMQPSKPAALEIARLFSQRGFNLVEHHADPRGITLRFKGDRKVVTQPVADGVDVLLAVGDALEAYDRAREGKHAHYHDRPPHTEDITVGSVFYVRIEPRGETATSIMAIGRPMKDGREACTADPDLATPCEPLSGGEPYWQEIGGFAEAEVVEGVFAELRLQADVVSPDPAITEAAAASSIDQTRCLARRRELQDLARRVTSARARAGILGAAPTCGG